MKFSDVWTRFSGRYQRSASSIFFKRTLNVCSDIPYISFTFDDFPRSALRRGGEILKRYDLRGTYYASLGLMGTKAPTGRLFIRDDIKVLIEQEHELGCHTYDHVHSWKTSPKDFKDSIIMNQQALNDLIPGSTFRSFSYPIIGPRPVSKKIAGSYFYSCRGGGQTYNEGNCDLNLLNAFFLEKCKGDKTPIKRMIDRNCEARGWLIFATHDISKNPTPYGCTPSLFEDIVKYSLASGAKILPVTEALGSIAMYSGIKMNPEVKSGKKMSMSCNISNIRPIV